jgi:Glu-tRNA(Gln) amidotransferase subunit E-like FAD-binding protein
MFIPAGTILTGKIHNFENIAILAQGTIRVSNGTDSYVLTAPHIMVDKPGVKRIGYAETDVTFITVHKTANTEIDDIEKELVSATFEEYEQQLLLGDLL